jgi:hypothetical protein
VLECQYSGDDEAPNFELECKSCGKKYLSSQGLGYVRNPFLGSQVITDIAFSICRIRQLVAVIGMMLWK